MKTLVYLILATATIYALNSLAGCRGLQVNFEPDGTISGRYTPPVAKPVSDK